MDQRVARRIAAIGDVVGPEQAAASSQIYAGLHEQPPYEGVALARDERYGPNERQRLDVFTAAGARDLPVIVFVHGGGFIGGDKSTPGTPYHENVGLWACRSGCVGVTMTYRLAPGHHWPAGAQDVAAAVAWLRENVAGFGGDPERIVLMGSSAGACHVACYAALYPEIEVRGLVLLSGAYDLLAFEPSILHPYFGDELEAASPLAGLVASRVPLMFVVAEHDPPISHRQAELLFAALAERDGRVPNLVFLPGHNHFTEVFHLNTDDRLLGDHVLEFVRAHAPAGVAAL
jgi:acetyl esterase/lipase